MRPARSPASLFVRRRCSPPDSILVPPGAALADSPLQQNFAMVDGAEQMFRQICCGHGSTVPWNSGSVAPALPVWQRPDAATTVASGDNRSVSGHWARSRIIFLCKRCCCCLTLEYTEGIRRTLVQGGTHY